MDGRALQSRRWILALLVVACSGASSAAAGSPRGIEQGSTPPASDTGKINGMTLSTPRGVDEWGGDGVVTAIGELHRLGVNWIAIHPYARIDRDGEVRWRWSRDEGAEKGAAPAWLRRPVEEAHRQGLKILVKPHLAYWGSFSWRGEIRFARPTEQERFFRTYGQWLVELARFVPDADALAVGTELDGTVEHDEAWRDLIAAVRDEYTGPLTYAANWSDYERVPFWDALDAIGIQAYFPLLEPGPAGTIPTQEELDAGWAAIMARLRRFGERHDRTIVFTELGYNLSDRAPYEPWDPEVGGEHAATLQERCLRAALRAIANEHAVVGAFLWKWFPGGRQPHDFAMSSPAMRRVIAEYWSPSQVP